MTSTMGLLTLTAERLRVNVSDVVMQAWYETENTVSTDELRHLLRTLKEVHLIEPVLPTWLTSYCQRLLL